MEYHQPVLLEESLKFLQIRPEGRYIDATLGDGGHSVAMLKLGGTVLGLDVNQKSLDRAAERITEA
ncbi:16S rRNA (cytosine(1402)-N(4))-methyltransferase, partial [Patescibacteria group bacterium]|nr:16S rRNA (cytosine(1402)-N(4))-methyltransferase [Patescibacteria group bacterium]